MTPIAAWTLQQGSKAIDAGMGLILGNIQDKRQLRQQEKLQNLQIKGQKEMTDYNTNKQMQLWRDTNYPAQVEQLKLAGLNPGLLYGMGGGGGATASISSGNVSGADAPKGGREVQDLMGMGLQYQLLNAQKEVLESQAEKNKAEASKITSTDTPNVQADTQNKILQSVILEYAGKEAKDVYNEINKPNRSIQAKTYEDELSARQGIAGTIYEMWVDGKLKEKSVAEVEQILLQNAKTREETRQIYKNMEMLEENIKGAKLDNIIKELETKLQTQTGIDRNSPTWFKILGRLFVTLMNK